MFIRTGKYDRLVSPNDRCVKSTFPQLYKVSNVSNKVYTWILSFQILYLDSLLSDLIPGFSPFRFYTWILSFQILYLTEPDSWSAAAMYQAARIFASNMNAKMAQRLEHTTSPCLVKICEMSQTLNLSLTGCVSAILFYFCNIFNYP